MYPAMPSVRSTQHPSPAVSRANSPTAQENSIAMPPPPADPPMPNSLTPIHMPTLQEIQDAGYHNFVLKIIAVKSTRANYNPAEAVQHLNAVLQDTLASKSGVHDIPRELYRVVYEEPPPGTFGTNGQFLCRIPKPLEGYIADLTAPKNEHGPLAFTGDDWDNAYKLELTTFTQKQFSAEMSREKNEKYWLHIILDRGNTLSKRTLYELTAQHLSKFGMTIQGHERAFFEKPDSNKEQGSGKWHCEYILDEDSRRGQDPTRRGQLLGHLPAQVDGDRPGNARARQDLGQAGKYHLDLRSLRHVLEAHPALRGPRSEEISRPKARVQTSGQRERAAPHGQEGREEVCILSTYENTSGRHPHTKKSALHGADAMSRPQDSESECVSNVRVPAAERGRVSRFRLISRASLRTAALIAASTSASIAISMRFSSLGLCISPASSVSTYCSLIYSRSTPRGATTCEITHGGSSVAKTRMKDWLAGDRAREMPAES